MNNKHALKLLKGDVSPLIEIVATLSECLGLYS